MRMEVCFFILLLFLDIVGLVRCNDDIPSCGNLPVEYFNCEDLKISKSTYEIEGCMKNHTILQSCTIKENIRCSGTEVITRIVKCRYTDGRSFTIALFLSLFLGFFGVDRIYLGYISLGLMKMVTLGFFGLGWMYDLIMISSGRLGPSNGSYLVRGYLFSFKRYRLGNDAHVPFL